MGRQSPVDLDKFVVAKPGRVTVPVSYDHETEFYRETLIPHGQKTTPAFVAYVIDPQQQGDGSFLLPWTLYTAVVIPDGFGGDIILNTMDVHITALIDDTNLAIRVIDEQRVSGESSDYYQDSYTIEYRFLVDSLKIA
jgi:hypothetical protein